MGSPFFVTDEDTIEIKFYVSRVGNTVFCDNEMDRLDGEVKKIQADATVETHAVTFRYPNFEDMTAALDKSIDMRLDSVSESKININRLRMARMSRLIKSWTFLDNDGKPIPANGESIQKLHPSIAGVMGVMLEIELKARNTF